MGTVSVEILNSKKLGISSRVVTRYCRKEFYSTSFRGMRVVSGVDLRPMVGNLRRQDVNRGGERMYVLYRERDDLERVTRTIIKIHSSTIILSKRCL